MRKYLYDKVTEAYNNLGVLCGKSIQTDFSLKYPHKALELDQMRANQVEIAKTSYDLGRIYRGQSKYWIAYAYQIKAVE